MPLKPNNSLVVGSPPIQIFPNEVNKIDKNTVLEKIPE